MKKIYRVIIDNEYYCVAENPMEAEDLYDEVRRNGLEDPIVTAWDVGKEEKIPKEWLNGLIYGVDEDITLKDWIARQEKEEAERKKQEELDARQLKLFEEKK